MLLKVAITSLVLWAIGLESFAFPQHVSLAGLSKRELDEILPSLKAVYPPTPPGPPADTSSKLVYDRAHPWKALKDKDIRGPCPGLNTLASHGYLPRNGIATPTQIITAVQEGFNMQNWLARFVAYAAMVVDGNVVTDLLSIGGKTRFTGPDPPSPAIVGGLNTHGVFEGDVSLTRNDVYFGDNWSFNQTLFDQLKDFSNRFGGGYYNLTVAAEYRWFRIQQSIATNPNFSFISPRYYTAYAESVFPVNFFVDGRKADGQLNMKSAEKFFKDSKFPDDFHRAPKPVGADGMDKVIVPHPIAPGANAGKVNSYTLDPTSADFSETGFCLLYTNFVNQTVRGLYPNPTGVLRRNLNLNLDYLYEPIKDGGCPQVFPFGRD